MDKEVVIEEKVQLGEEAAQLQPIQEPCIPQFADLFGMLAGAKIGQIAPNSQPQRSIPLQKVSESSADANCALGPSFE